MTSSSLPRQGGLTVDSGVDDEPYVVHVRVHGGVFSYCGQRLTGRGTYLPPEEVTEPSWCPDCVRIQDGL